MFQETLKLGLCPEVKSNEAEVLKLEFFFISHKSMAI